MLYCAGTTRNFPPTHPKVCGLYSLPLQSLHRYLVEEGMEGNSRELDILFEYHAERGSFEGQDWVACALRRANTTQTMGSWGWTGLLLTGMSG